MCPDDDRCLCRAWAEAAKEGRQHGVLFRSLEQVGSNTWEATGRTYDGTVLSGGVTDHPRDALASLGLVIKDYGDG